MSEICLRCCVSFAEQWRVLSIGKKQWNYECMSGMQIDQTPKEDLQLIRSPKARGLKNRVQYRHLLWCETRLMFSLTIQQANVFTIWQFADAQDGGKLFGGTFVELKAEDVLYIHVHWCAYIVLWKDIAFLQLNWAAGVSCTKNISSATKSMCAHRKPSCSRFSQPNPMLEAARCKPSSHGRQRMRRWKIKSRSTLQNLSKEKRSKFSSEFINRSSTLQNWSNVGERFRMYSTRKFCQVFLCCCGFVQWRKCFQARLGPDFSVRVALC